MYTAELSGFERAAKGRLLGFFPIQSPSLKYVAYIKAGRDLFVFFLAVTIVMTTNPLT